MQILIILDYKTKEVHTFNIDDKICINEDFISKLWTFDANNIEWMVASNFNLIKHQGIYK